MSLHSNAPKLPRDRVFWALLTVTLVFRAWFAWRLPITGDEAYFYYWGANPDWGFYDHPPMVGWWLALLARWSTQPWVLRLPTLLLPVALAMMAWSLLRHRSEALATTAASLLLVLPLSAWNVAITTDIPLIFFSALTLCAYVVARRTERLHWYVVCGLMLGGALLSKYFAGLLALALASHMLFGRGRPPWLGLFCIVLFSLPAAAVQVYWNSGQCWPNVMFNLVNRHGNAGLSWRTPLLYLVTVIYVLTPAVLWGLLRSHTVSRVFDADRHTLAWVSLFGFVAFLALSLVKTIGLHWIALFIFPAALWFVLAAEPARLAPALRWASGIAAVHYLIIIAALAVPLETYSGWRGYPGLVMTLAPDDLTRAIEPYRKHNGKRLSPAADGYSPAVTIGFNLRDYTHVYGPGSSHARHDDILTDWRKLDGQDVLIIRRESNPAIDDRRFFDRVERHEILIRGARFHLTQGFGFRYEPYRDEVLEGIRARYYAVPKWLPAGPCYFCDRYFPERACHR